MTTTERHTHIEQVAAAIQKRWGVKALRRLENTTVRAVGIPTGSPALDGLLGSGGIPRGAVTCLSGRPTSGKTTLALDMVARVQADGEVTVCIDLTGALDPEYAEGRGIDLDHLLIVQPQPPALGLEITRDIITSGGAGLVVVHASAHLEGLHRPLQQVSAAVRRSPYALVCLADGRGDVLAARADIHLRAERQRWLMNTEGVSGYETRLTVMKSRFGPPDRSVTVPITLSERRPGP